MTTITLCAYCSALRKEVEENKNFYRCNRRCRYEPLPWVGDLHGCETGTPKEGAPEIAIREVAE